jgi:hypothetical protein
MSLIGQLVALGNQLTQSLGAAATVTYIAAATTDGAGKEIAPSVPRQRPAIVNKSQKVIKTASGELVMSTAYVAFLDPAPVSEYDKIILPDGSTGPILQVTAFFDGSNGPILSEVYLG